MVDGAYAIPLRPSLRMGNEDMAVRRFFDAIGAKSADNRREIRAAVPSVEPPPRECPQDTIAAEENPRNRVVPSRAKVINSHALIVPLIEKPRRDAEHPNLCAEPKIAIRALRNGADSDGRLGQRHRSEMLTVETRQTFGGGNP